jgi:hypothetical protein
MQRYWVESQELWSADDRSVIWHGRPDEKPVVAVVAIPGTEDAVVVLDAEAGPRTPLGDLKGWPHLLRVGPTGAIIWRSEAGTSSGDRDWWLGVEATSGALTASTWSGFQKVLDKDTGRVLSSTFTK